MSEEVSNSVNISQQESLLAASSSDKVAASRAMKQNLQLKKQVEELESAVIQAVSFKSFFLHLLSRHQNSGKSRITEHFSNDQILTFEILKTFHSAMIYSICLYDSKIDIKRGYAN